MAEEESEEEDDLNVPIHFNQAGNPPPGLHARDVRAQAGGEDSREGTPSTDEEFPAMEDPDDVDEWQDVEPRAVDMGARPDSRASGGKSAATSATSSPVKALRDAFMQKSPMTPRRLQVLKDPKGIITDINPEKPEAEYSGCGPSGLLRTDFENTFFVRMSNNFADAAMSLIYRHLDERIDAHRETQDRRVVRALAGRVAWADTLWFTIQRLHMTAWQPRDMAANGGLSKLPRVKVVKLSYLAWQERGQKVCLAAEKSEHSVPPHESLAKLWQETYAAVSRVVCLKASKWVCDVFGPTLTQDQRDLCKRIAAPLEF